MLPNKKESRTLIVYDSRYGCTEKCSKIIKDKFENVDIVNIKNSPEDIGFYDTIIIGGSIYMGKIQKSVREFCKRHIRVLVNKKLGLFISCTYIGERGKEQLLSSFPKEMLEVAKAKDFFGGEITYKKMKLFDRIMTKLVSKGDSPGTLKLDEFNNATNLMEEKIEHFCSLLLQDN